MKNNGTNNKNKKNNSNKNNNDIYKNVEHRIQKIISEIGYCSRRKAEELKKKKKVKINGKIAEIGEKCNINDKIEIENKIISNKKKENIYIVMNKKKGITCTNKDEFNRKTIFDNINIKTKLFSVGRLDKDTTGLIIITNDGELTQKIIHPSQNIEKEYIATLNKDLLLKDKIEIEKGLILDKQKLSKCKITNIKKNIVKIIIKEGKKRQIRRVFEIKGYIVKELKRIRIGNLELDKLNLKEGEYKHIEKKLLEKKILFFSSQ